MRRRGAQRAALALLAFVLAVPATAGGDGGGVAESDDCAARTTSVIQQRYQGVEDLWARFVQTNRPAGGAGSVSSTRGTVVLAVPGRMRWTYEAPEPSLMVSDGETLWLYDPGAGEAQRLPVGDGGYLSGAAIQFLLGKGDILREFRVRAISCETDSVELSLHPREPAAYEKLHVVVDPASGEVRRTRVVDLLGNTTDIEFSELRYNQRPSPEQFRFEPPDGTRVVDISG